MVALPAFKNCLRFVSVIVIAVGSPEDGILFQTLDCLPIAEQQWSADGLA
jgi:hypothetical protein